MEPTSTMRYQGIDLAFQHLFNNALNECRPISLSEFGTRAPTNFVADCEQFGEPDFYVNRNYQWCIDCELLRNGVKITEHMQRLQQNVSKYRKVPTREYTVVDCRSPRPERGVQGNRVGSQATLHRISSHANTTLV